MKEKRNQKHLNEATAKSSQFTVSTLKHLAFVPGKRPEQDPDAVNKRERRLRKLAVQKDLEV